MGTHSKWTPYRAAPGGPSPPYLTSLRSLSVRGHQAPSPKQKAGPTPAGAPNRRSRLHLPLRVGPLSRSAPGAVPHSVRGRGRNPAANHVGPGPHRGTQVRLRPPLRATAAPRSLRPRRPLLRCSPARGAPRHSAPPPRRPAGPQPPHRPEQPETLRGPLRGGKTAPPRPPRPPHSPLSVPHTGPPATTPPGTGARSAPPEPIRQACAMLGSVATPPCLYHTYRYYTYW
ncbi:hypothetical protein NDU88_009262 [Pleurodeles waltl]|uniref:Basic proline-rich protein-like n=1 Tax=Pleurodeles waltl TaxID=8319 RepID=A0AAV7S0I2_PLEWA|nr:hypothetical protein NDU88_009262 [Pleurodeles waltl]